MNNTFYNLLGSLSPEVGMLSGSFDCNGSSDPASLEGDIKTVTHDGTGTYTVTFKGNAGWPKFLTAFVVFEGDKTHGDEVVFTAHSNSARQLTVVTKDSGGDTDIPSGENMRVHVLVLFSNLSI